MTTICCNNNSYPLKSNAICEKALASEYNNALLHNSSWDRVRARTINTCNTGILNVSNWYSYVCYMDTNGCRNYIANLMINHGVQGSGKPLVDCVALESPFPNQLTHQSPWGLAYQSQSSNSSCDATGRADYFTQFGVCNYNSGSVCQSYPAPTAQPTIIPSPSPSTQPTVQPTPIPTIKSTVPPIAKPTTKPSPIPSAKPTVQPTAKPTVKPTAKPTVQPTAKPTVQPTAKPTAKPT